MKDSAGAAERLQFLADVVTREASYLSQTDGRLFSKAFGLNEVASLPGNPDLAERVDAFVARFGRLQDTLSVALLLRRLEALLEPLGSVLDKLNRPERLGWLRSASDCDAACRHRRPAGCLRRGAGPAFARVQVRNWRQCRDLMPRKGLPAPPAQGSVACSQRVCRLRHGAFP